MRSLEQTDQTPRKLGNKLVRPKKITQRFSGRLSPPLNLIVIFLAKSKVANIFMADFDLMRIGYMSNCDSRLEDAKLWNKQIGLQESLGMNWLDLLFKYAAHF